MERAPGDVLVVPGGFMAELAAEGDVALEWVTSLPELVGNLAAAWRVELDLGSPRFGANALVVLGAWRGERCALKLSKPGYSLRPEADALLVWDGHGAVRLLERSSKDNALLLEGLNADRSLESVPIDEAASVVARLIRDLAVPAPSGFRGSFDVGQATAEYHAKQDTLGGPLPDEWVLLAADVLADLVGHTSRAIVPSDLHSGNVLAGSRQPWLAIDPRPVVGEPEMSIADFLLWRLPVDASLGDVDSLVATMVTAGDLDMRRARQWTIVRTVAHWLWCCDADSELPPDAPRCSVCAPRCTRILESLT